MSLSPGTKLGPYEVIAPLGAGGMGEVYRARDKKLDRDVAVKVLPESVAADPDTLARFEREAKAVAALSHQNILAIHDFGNQDGIAYAVMELLEGETLRGKLDAGPIPQKQAVDYALQVAKGLSAAHEKGIVHRDLKPENLFVSKDGHLKILDFGLAKRVEAVAPGKETSAPTGSGHTEPGTVMGTMGYMSPEQVKGFQVDHRSDIFSFGAILYELLSGKKAFKRETGAETMAAIMRDEPPELSQSGRDISPALDRVVKHCLEKDREHRFQSVRDIAFSLSDPSAPAPASASRGTVAPAASEGLWVAVLPFKYGGADTDLSALADGIAEEIGTGLSRFRYLSVVASASAARLKKESEDERVLAAKLGARYVVEGSIRGGGSALRVSAQLVDAQTGAQLWSETFNRDLKASTVFEAQDDVAARIVATVADSYGVLVHSMRATNREKDDAHLTPVEWQFQYFAYREQITPTAHAQLKSRLERAVERDGRQSDLWACLAQLHVDAYAFGFQGDAGSLDRALAAARRAVELDRANQFALVALAQTHFFRQDLAAFGPAAERAMALNPLNTDAVGILGLQIVHTGEFERGTAIVRRAMELNANHAGWMHFAPLWEHFHKGEYEQALERANRVDVPGLFWPYLVMASACGHLGRSAEAQAAVRDLLALDPEFAAHARSNVGTWHFASGLMEPILEGLRKAGLSIPAADGSPDAERRIGTVTAKTERVEPATASGPARADEGFWVAVLPFKYGGANADLTALADGLSDEIVTGLSRFSYLRVIARSSTARFSGESDDVRAIGKELGARYVMEGTLRQAGGKLRLAVQLVDTVPGAHLWAESFERAFSPESLFELQDDLVPRIVSTVADMAGVLPRSMSEDLRSRPPEQLSPYEAVLRSFAYFERFNPEELTAARAGLEAAVRKAPAYADAWAMLSYLCAQDYVHGYDLQPDALKTAASAARRAVQLGPSNHLAYFSLAQSLSYQKDFDSFRDAAERAVELNPMDGNSVALLGELLTYAGSAERGMQLVDRAKRLNPNHPGSHWYADFYHAFSQGDYRGALGFALKVRLRGNPLAPMFIAAACGQLGDADQGSKAVGDVLRFRPELPALMRKQVAKIWNPEYGERFLDGLSKAGLQIPEVGDTANRPTIVDSSEMRADEGFWVAVLPFKYGGADVTLTTLAEGLTEGIVTGLSRFSYLRVISRTSGGGNHGARYVMEGSLRQAGAKLRLAVQLVDTISGAHLWAEDFERTFTPDAAFELQDDLVPRIVSTVADQYGVLVHSMSESLRGRGAGEYSPHEAVLRAFGYWERVTPEEHAEVRDILEAAVARAPSHGDCLAELSLIYWHEYAFGYNMRPDPLGRARAAAQRAVASAPTSHFAHSALATALFFQKDFQAFRTAAERALALNRMDASTAAILGTMIAYACDWEYGLGIVERAKQLNPHHPGWYQYVALTDAYRRRDYREALAIALKVNMPGYHWPHALLAAVYGQLGERQRASAALRELHALIPDFGKRARGEFDKWHDAELTEHWLDGLRKAGLEISEDSAKPSGGASPATTGSGAVLADEGFWVGVLPFKYGGTDASLTALAEGLTEEIVTGLSRFSYLRVTARASSARGARYVMEGSLRQAGSKLRIAVQLVDAGSGAHLWAEAYERTFNPEAVFELQDELVPRIVATVADRNGVLTRSLSEAVRSRDPEQLSPYEAVLRSFGYFERVTPEELASARSALESALRKAPAYADAWAMLALLCVQDYAQGFDLQPDSLTSGVTAARRAVETAPSNPLAHFSLAQAFFSQKEFQSFRNEAERAVALNPMDGNSIAFLGSLLTYAGDGERGLALVGRAKQLNPNHPGWYWYANFYDAYRRGDYRGALSFARKVNLPGHWGMHASVAAACGQLGERDAAAKGVRELLKLRPDFAARVRAEFERSWEPAYVEAFLDGLRKAGLKIAPREAVTAPASAQGASGAARADEGFWVAVLPFKYGGAEVSLTNLAEGLTEEIVTGLSRFSYLRVISRRSAADAQSAGKDLGARYVIEGSLRHVGTMVRLAVQLVDAATGAHLWAENYERAFSPEAVFELQDELVPRIVSTVADMHGVLPRTMSEALRGRAPEQLSPYEAVLRSFGYSARVTPEELDAARSGLELAVRRAPDYADAWAMLAWLRIQDYAQGFDLQADSLASGLTAARRAVEAAPSNHLAHCMLAQALFFHKEFQSFRNAAERSVALNPMNGDSVAFLGELLTYAGDSERGLELAGRAKQLNPSHPGWYWYAEFYDAYRRGDHRGALGFALKVNLPGQWFSHAAMAAAYGQLGERDAAKKALKDLLKLRPDFAARARADIEKWWEPAYVESMIDGWRKAGLEIAPKEGFAAPVRVPARDASGATRAGEGFWVAVLPFKHSGGDTAIAAFAEGMTDEIVTGLSRFSYLRVLSGGSTSRDAGDGADARTVGAGLGARYVLDGNVRQAGSMLRVSVQLIDAESGAHLWAETYSRPFQPEGVFELQDDLVSRIVATVGDPHGILPHTMSELLRNKAPGDLSPYEAVLRSFGFGYRSTAEEHAAVRDALEKAVRDAPRDADAWAMLSLIYVHEYAHEFNVRPDPLGRAIDAARRAAALAPSSAVAYDALAWALFFRKEYAAFRAAAEQALALNPLSSPTLAGLGTLTAYSGDWEKGCALVERAVQLNPRHPGWYRFALFANAYRQRDYRGAVDIALKLNLPDFFVTHEVLAAAYGQLGERDAAAKALKELLRLRPDYAETGREKLEKWFGPKLVEHWMDGLRKAGLETAGGESTAAPEAGEKTAHPSTADSGAARADEGFWVAVLPFRYAGTTDDGNALADGLTEEIITGLSRFSYLRVLARGSTAKYSGEASDIRSIGKELGARFVLEGSLRHAGGQLRVAVQLVDAVSGAHLWAETYARPFQADQAFAIQDDLVPRIVSTCADHFGVLARTISDAVRGKPVDGLTPYEALMRGFGYHFRLSPEEHAQARDALERAVEGAPANADCWAMLSWVYAHEHAHGFNPRPGSLDRALAAARRAVDLAPTNPLAQQALAVALFFRKETAACLSAAERAIALNPLDGSSEAIFLITFAGGWDRGLTLMRWAMDVNPYHPRWYELVLGINEYRLGRYRAAVDEIVKANLPDHFWKSMMLAAAHGQLGELDAAREALRDLLVRKPDFSESGAQFLGKWFDPQLVGNLLEGLRKAGLGVEPAKEAPAQVAIAVLPFTDMSAAKDQAYLCEGMAEEIMNALVRVEGIRVASRTSSFRARRDGGDLPAIARALSVGHVLEGSVRTSGSRLRVTAQLTDVATGFQLWSERFDREAADIFAVQDEITRGVVDAVKAHLSPGDHAVPVRPQPANLEAYRSYLKGRHLRGKEHLDGALRAFEDAVRLDPAFAPAWTGLAEATVLASVFGLIPARDACETARNALVTATRLQGESADSLHVEGFVAWIEGRWAAMEAAWRRAIDLQPTHVLTLASFGIVLCTRERLDEARPILERARQADPLSSFPYALTGGGLLSCGKPQEALRYLEDALSFEKDDATALDNAGIAQVALGRVEEGIATLEHVVAVTHRGAHFLGSLGWALATAGRTAEARKILAELRARPPGSPAVVSEAWLLGALGEVDAAFEVVARADEERHAYLYFIGLPGFDSLRADPRFGALLERLGLPSQR